MAAPNRILVAGGGGRLGRALQSTGATSLLRSELDITNARSISSALEERRPDLVINAAAYTDVEGAETDRDTAFAINATGAGELAQACATANIPLVHVSTDYVFGDGSPEEPVSEASPPNPLSCYGESKLAGELAVQAVGGTHTIVRVSWLFDQGPDTFVGKMLNVAAGRDEMKVVDEAFGRPTSVGDLAPKLKELAEMILDGKTELPQILHMGPPDPVSRFAWAEEIFRGSGAQGGPAPRLSPCSASEFPTKVRHPLGLVLDVTTAEALLGPMADWQSATEAAVKRQVTPTH
ncbi:MAG: dTDP-4-dehydrorhamnose reductase [Pseudomonadota bacterium]